MDGRVWVAVLLRRFWNVGFGLEKPWKGRPCARGPRPSGALLAALRRRQGPRATRRHWRERRRNVSTPCRVAVASRRPPLRSIDSRSVARSRPGLRAAAAGSTECDSEEENPL